MCILHKFEIIYGKVGPGLRAETKSVRIYDLAVKVVTLVSDQSTIKHV